MANFCGKCGFKLDKKTGLCPKCDNVSKKEKKKKRKNVKKRGFLKVVLRLLLVIVISGGVLGGLVYYDILDIAFVDEFLIFIGVEIDDTEKIDNNENVTESDDISAPDAETYYAENSKVVSKIDVNNSDKVYTEAETVAFLKNLNFTKYPITTHYSMDGTYYDEVDILDTSLEQHPIYETYYVSENGDLWTIYLINGDIIATPISYNMQSELGVELVISERNTVTSYDSITNQFYETIPNKSALIVMVVDKINAETLEKLTIGEIDNYVQNQM